MTVYSFIREFCKYIDKISIYVILFCFKPSLDSLRAAKLTARTFNRTNNDCHGPRARGYLEDRCHMKLASRLIIGENWLLVKTM